MTRPIKRTIKWPAGREATQQVGPYPVWEVFKERTIKKYFPDSTCPIKPENESFFKDYYIARRLYQSGEANADKTMAEWRKRVETEKGEDFYEKYRTVLDVILQETTTPSWGKERKR